MGNLFPKKLKFLDVLETPSYHVYMKKITIIILLILIFPALVLFSEEAGQLRVGVLEFDEKNDIGIDKAGVIIPEILVSHLKSIGKYQLTERVLLKEILEEQKLQLSGLIDDTTAAEVGKIYGLEAIIVGSVMKIINTTTISGRVVAVETGEILASGVIKFDNLENIENELEGLAYQLCGTSKDDYKRMKVASNIAKSRYGIRLGTGFSTSSGMDAFGLDYDEITISGWAPLYLSLYYYGKYFDVEFFGFPPPSNTTVVGALVNINPFTHLGFGFGYITMKQQESSDSDASYVEADSVVIGLNYRATSRLRMALYFGMALSAMTVFEDDFGGWYEYEVKNYIGGFPPAAMLMTMEYLVTDNLSVMLLYTHNGGSEEEPITPTAIAMYPDTLDSSTNLLTLAVGYSFTF